MQTKPNSYTVLFVLFLVYISWGSSYVATKFGLLYFPPFLLSGIRATLAGSILFIVSYSRGERTKITLKDFKHYLILGIFMVLFSSGFLSKGQETVPSGTTAMILGAIPIWMILIGWLFFKEEKPSKMQLIGLLGAFGSLCLINIYQGVQGQTSLLGLIFIFLSTWAWVIGSYFSKNNYAHEHLSAMQSTAFLLLLGGIETITASLLLQERVNLFAVPFEGWLALSYLLVMPSIIGYGSYIWLLRNTRTIVAISYEFVSPVLAIFLGWLILAESVNIVSIGACAMLLTSVFFVVQEHSK